MPMSRKNLECLQADLEAARADLSAAQQAKLSLLDSFRTQPMELRSADDRISNAERAVHRAMQSLQEAELSVPG